MKQLVNMKQIDQTIKEIKPDELYKPMTIAKNGWIRNSGNTGDYYLVLKLIHANRLLKVK